MAIRAKEIGSRVIAIEPVPGNATLASLQSSAQWLSRRHTGRETISVHRPVLLIELNRVHHKIRGIDFDTAILSLLPAHYILAELGASGIVQISNLAECSDTDFLAVPEERRHELRQRQGRSV
jgi:hypothetical protein